MGVEKINIKNFTVFKDVEISLSEGINIFIGENGTGKTHILKLIYVSQIINKFLGEDKLFNCFGETIYNLTKNNYLIEIEVINKNSGVDRIINRYRNGIAHSYVDDKSFKDDTTLPVFKMLFPIIQAKSIFIPAKDMLTHSNGLPEMKEKYVNNMPFDKTLIDIIKKAKQWKVESIPEMAKKTTPILEKIMDGVVVIENDTFYIQKNNGDMINFSVEAEGIKKIGLLWQLLMNENITKGSILIWDEPEANLNPKLIPDLVEILLELSRNGVQIFIATHDYILAKYFDVRRKENDNILFYSLFKTDEGVKASESQTFKDLNPNPIVESFDDLMGEIYSNLKGD